jgi:penicillin-binding protein 1A
VDEIGRPSAGKTGTSENFVDAWYIGYVPQLTTSVWVGYPEERVPMVNINGLPEINGENYPLDIWSLYMQGAVGDLPVEQLDTPSDDLQLRLKTTGRALDAPTPATTGGTTRETTAQRTTRESTTPQTSPASNPPPQQSLPQQLVPQQPTPTARPPSAQYPVQ